MDENPKRLEAYDRTLRFERQQQFSKVTYNYSTTFEEERNI